MTITINWFELSDITSECIELPFFSESLLLHFSGDVITQTEWKIAQNRQEKSVLELNSQWGNIQRYLLNPDENLTVNLEKKSSVYRNKVWAEISKIPVGQTQTYSALASRIGSGARAVANACRDNPFPVLIPCHRVVAVSGIGGYMGQTSGQALAIKCQLLALEADLVRNKEDAE